MDKHWVSICRYLCRLITPQNTQMAKPYWTHIDNNMCASAWPATFEQLASTHCMDISQSHGFIHGDFVQTGRMYARWMEIFCGRRATRGMCDGDDGRRVEHNGHSQLINAATNLWIVQTHTTIFACSIRRCCSGIFMPRCETMYTCSHELWRAVCTVHGFVVLGHNEIDNVTFIVVNNHIIIDIRRYISPENDTCTALGPRGTFLEHLTCDIRVIRAACPFVFCSELRRQAAQGMADRLSRFACV